MRKITDRIFCLQSESGALTYYIDDKVKVLIDAGTLINKHVDLIILTHCHFDHIMYLHELKQRYGCKVLCHANEREAVETLSEKTLSWLSPKKILPCNIDATLKDGDRLSTGKFMLEIIEVPGHTDGSIAIFEPKQKILFSGDTWFGNNSVGRADLPSGNQEELLRSVGRLKKLKPRILCPGH